MHGINGDSHRYTCRTRSQCVRTVRCICKKKLERALHVTLIARGESVKIMGDALKVEKSKKNVLDQLVELSKRGNTIQEQNVDYTLALVMEDSEENVLEIDKDIICHTLQGKPIKPKTLGQKK